MFPDVIFAPAYPPPTCQHGLPGDLTISEHPPARETSAKSAAPDIRVDETVEAISKRLDVYNERPRVIAIMKKGPGPEIRESGSAVGTRSSGRGDK